MVKKRESHLFHGDRDGVTAMQMVRLHCYAEQGYSIHKNKNTKLCPADRARYVRKRNWGEKDGVTAMQMVRLHCYAEQGYSIHKNKNTKLCPADRARYVRKRNWGEKGHVLKYYFADIIAR
ncbi:hypothetical protein EOD39_16103 [Acipenser ruthenus]|uniref:Uncharacterized protein n=1 Tax=Acipenser ruthenus TaxID=7906 RepID=A0A444V6Q3_ACIRT|nr:hypothetical protein EOD39_16103 [Acipenser ruthenus]